MLPSLYDFFNAKKTSINISEDISWFIPGILIIKEFCNLIRKDVPLATPKVTVSDGTSLWSLCKRIKRLSDTFIGYWW